LSLLFIAAGSAAEIILPDDPKAVLDMKKEGGAKGDGVTDDTDALQKAIEGCANGQTRFIYLPKGIYRITRPLVLRPNDSGKEGSMIGPWIYGQDRDGTIIRLADGAKGFGDASKPRAAIRGLSRPDGAKMNADFFDRTLVNLTIDTGKNPGAVAIAFYSNNTGLMQDVTLTGDGTTGIDLGTHDQNGPLLIQDVSIAGFATGIRCGAMLNSQTLSRISIRARAVGLAVQGQVVAAEGLEISATPRPVTCDDNAVLSLIDCRFTAPKGATGAAVTVGKATLYVQNLSTSGFATAIAGGDQPATGPTVAEWTSSASATVGAGSPAKGLGLKHPREPVVAFPTKAEDWVCANDFGAAFGDEDDDAPAIQKAVDAAAAKGAKAVYLRGADRGDPNWYWLKSDVKIHGSVERVMGFGFARILGGSTKEANFPENLGKWVVDEDPKGAKTVIIQHLKVFSNWPTMGYEVRSRTRTLVLRSLEGTAIARPGTTIYISNVAGSAYIEPGATMIARQWNTEGRVEGGAKTNTLNNGGTLWVLGMKTEHDGTKLITQAGGRSEVLGVHNYNTTGVKDDAPFFKVTDASLSVSGYREITWGGQWWKVPVLLSTAGTEARHPPHEWQTWALLRAGK